MNSEFLEKFSLKGRKALILGGSKGIGLICSQFLASLDAEILAVARDESALIEMKDTLYGDKHEIFAADLSLESSIQTLLNKLKIWGCPDIIISNLYIRKPPERLLNYTNTNKNIFFEYSNYLLQLIPFCLPDQRKKKFGRWIGISSMTASIPSVGQMEYALQKNMIESIFKTLAVEEGIHGITANVVSPGIIDTPGVNSNYSQEILKTFAKMNVIGRSGSAEEVAHLVAFLASPVSSYITGVNIPICGGYDLGWAIPFALKGKLNL